MNCINSYGAYEKMLSTVIYGDTSLFNEYDRIHFIIDKNTHQHHIERHYLGKRTKYLNNAYPIIKNRFGNQLIDYKEYNWGYIFTLSIVRIYDNLFRVYSFMGWNFKIC